MTQLPSAFNSSQYDSMNDFSTIPEGDYIASIVKSDVVMTKKAKEANNPELGQMLKMQAKILAGKYKGKIIFIQLNIVNPNPTAMEIAQKELATICRACNTPVIQDTVELHGIPMEIVVAIETSANYPDKNVIQMYKKSDGSVPDSSVSDNGKSAINGNTEPKKRPWD